MFKRSVNLLLLLSEFYFPIFLISQSTKAITKTTMITPIHIPAFKSSPTASQLDNTVRINTAMIGRANPFLMMLFFKIFKLLLFLK